MQTLTTFIWTAGYLECQFYHSSVTTSDNHPLDILNQSKTGVLLQQGRGHLALRVGAARGLRGRLLLARQERHHPEGEAAPHAGRGRRDGGGSGQVGFHF